MIKEKVKVQIGVVWQKELVELLKENSDIFAVSFNLIEGISQELIEHHLQVNSKAKVVWQKLRQLRSERREATNLEIQRLLKVGFTQEI